MTPDQIKELRRLADRAEGAATLLREALDEAVAAAPEPTDSVVAADTRRSLLDKMLEFDKLLKLDRAVIDLFKMPRRPVWLGIDLAATPGDEEAPDAAINPKAKWSHEMAQEIARGSYWGKQPVDRVTVESIEAKIVREDFFTGVNGNTLTICILTLANGFTVTGESACVDPRNFDPELGKKYAREAAFEKIWPLEGYLLREQMAKREAAPFPAVRAEGGTAALDDLAATLGDEKVQAASPDDCHWATDAACDCDPEWRNEQRRERALGEAIKVRPSGLVTDIIKDAAMIEAYLRDGKAQDHGAAAPGLD